MAATHQAPPTTPPAVRRPASRTLSPEESKKNRLLLASLKEQLVLLKCGTQIAEFKKKHSAVLNYIRMKSIAQQWINNTYDKMMRKESHSLKINAREQCLSDEVTPDKYLRQREDSFDICWQRDFIIYANGEWNVGDSYSPPASPPKSPQSPGGLQRSLSVESSRIGKMSRQEEEVWTVPRKNKNNPVEKLTLSPVNEKKRITFPDDGFDHVAEHFNRDDNYMILPNPQDNYVKSLTKKNDGPTITAEVALANAIEIWYSGGFTNQSSPFPEFWNNPRILEYKEQGHLSQFGKLINDSIAEYDAGKKVTFKSKSPFRMTDSLKDNLGKMFFQYSKKYPTNAEAKPFIMPVTYS